MFTVHTIHHAPPSSLLSTYYIIAQFKYKYWNGFNALSFVIFIDISIDTERKIIFLSFISFCELHIPLFAWVDWQQSIEKEMLK